MITKRLSNEFMDKVLNDAAWKSVCEDFTWTEQTLEKYKDKVDWKAVSDNRHILWTPSMLEKFKHKLDWTALSQTSSQTLLNAANLERFKDYWDWSQLSSNSDLEITQEMIDKFIDCWDWSELIDRYHSDEIYTIDFLEKYQDHIPTDKLQHSVLWRRMVEIRQFEIAFEIVS